MLSPLLTREVRGPVAIELVMTMETLKSKIWYEYVMACGNKNVERASLMGILFGRIQKLLQLRAGGITPEQLNRIRVEIDEINLSISKFPQTCIPIGIGKLGTQSEKLIHRPPFPPIKKREQPLPSIPEETDEEEADLLS